MINLENIGITKDEYIVYEAILKKPPVNISTLAKEVGITRVTLYKILERLEEKGLVEKVENLKTKIKYKAQSPDKLLDYVSKFKENSQKQMDLLRRQIPVLQAIAGDNSNLDESEIMIFRGPNAMVELDDLVFQSKEQLYGFTYDYHIEACFKLDKNWIVQNNEYLRVLLNCGDKFVFPGTKEAIASAEKLMKLNPLLKGKWQPRWIDPNKFKIKINFYCFEDKVAFSLGSFKQKDFLAYLIKNKEIAESMINLSMFLWENANKIN